MAIAARAPGWRAYDRTWLRGGRHGRRHARGVSAAGGDRRRLARRPAAAGGPLRVPVRRARVLAVLQLPADGHHRHLGDLAAGRRDARRDVGRRPGAPGHARRVHGADGRGAGLRGVRRRAPAPSSTSSRKRCSSASSAASRCSWRARSCPSCSASAAATAISGSAWAISCGASAAPTRRRSRSGVAALVAAAARQDRPEEPARRAVRGRSAASSRARMLHLDERGVALLGEVPRGLPMPALPLVSRADINALLPLAMACFVLAAVETTAIGRMFAAKHGYRLDATQEFLAIGGANLAAGLGGGFPVSGGMSQSLVNETAGARTPLSGLVAALITLVVVAVLHRPAALPAAAGAGGDRAGRRHGTRPGRRAAPHLALQPDGVRRGDGGAARRARLGSPERRAARRRAVDRPADPPRRASARDRDRARPRHVVLRRSRRAIRRTSACPTSWSCGARGRSSTSTSITCAIADGAPARAGRGAPAARSSSWATSLSWISPAPNCWPTCTRRCSSRASSSGWPKRTGPCAKRCGVWARLTRPALAEAHQTVDDVLSRWRTTAPRRVN